MIIINNKKHEQLNFAANMSAFFIMIGASLLLAIGFLIAFIWSVKTNQYEDDYTPSVRMLFDNTTKQDNKQESKKNKTKKYGTTKISVR